MGKEICRNNSTQIGSFRIRIKAQKVCCSKSSVKSFELYERRKMEWLFEQYELSLDFISLMENQFSI